MKAEVGFCPQAVAQLGFLGGRLGSSSIWQGAASDTFLFLFPLGLLPQCTFPNASVLGQRAVAVLLVSGNSEAILRAVSDEAYVSLSASNTNFTVWICFC